MNDMQSPPDAISELDAGARGRVRLAGLAAGLAAAVLLAVAGSGLRQSLFDVFQTVTPTPDVSRRVHVVVIDAESLRDIGGWPWSRFYLARLVEQIADRGASAIGFDLLMPEADRLDPVQFANLYPDLKPAVATDIRNLPSMDAVLARVIGRSPVVLARASIAPGSFDSIESASAPLPPAALFTGKAPRGLPDYATVVANIPILDGAALGQGLVNGDRDPDGVLRRVPLVARAGGELTPGFALELVRVAEGASQIELQSANARLTAVRVGKRRVPATPDGQLALRFGDWRRTQTTSAANLFRQGLPADLFKDQIVLIGLTAAGASEVTDTPRARAVSSLYVQAQAVDAILRGSGLRRPDWAAPAEWGIGLLLVLAACLWAPRAPMAAVAVTGPAAAVIAFGGSWLAFQNNLLIDPLPMLAPGAAASAATVLLLVIEGRRAQARLRANLEDQRHGAERRQRLLIDELNHRVKNTLTTVQSIAAQTARNTRDPARFASVFMARLGALAQAHELLSEASWNGASLADVLARTLAPYAGGREEGRVSLAGPAIQLGPNAAVTLNMAFHELATNAAKYGALSAPGGRVEVTWSLDPSPDAVVVAVDWRETGGPRVAQPERRGFGSRLIEQALAREFEGAVQLIFAPEGVCCRMRLPLSTKMRVAA